MSHSVNESVEDAAIPWDVNVQWLLLSISWAPATRRVFETVRSPGDPRLNLEKGWLGYINIFNRCENRCSNVERDRGGGGDRCC